MLEYYKIDESRFIQKFAISDTVIGNFSQAGSELNFCNSIILLYEEN
jgi:hypothetical protein